MPEPQFDISLYPPLRPDTTLHACLICGAVIPEKGVSFHDQWHEAIAESAIAAHARIDRLEGGRP
jgi:hypothetical protein